jgi:hypothetical protein
VTLDSIYDCVKGFQKKLVWQLKNENYAHFSTLPQSNVSEVQNPDKCVECISNLRKKSSSRLSDFMEKETFMQMFSSPPSVDTDSTPSNLQLEFADFQCDSV